MTSLLFYLAAIPWQLADRLAAGIVHSCQKDVPVQKKALGLHRSAIFICKKTMMPAAAQKVGRQVQGLYQGSQRIKDPRPCTCASDDSTHDFFCFHTSTSNITPAEDAGIRMLGDGKSTIPTGNTLTCDTTLACLFLPVRVTRLFCMHYVIERAAKACRF